MQLKKFAERYYDQFYDCYTLKMKKNYQTIEFKGGDCNKQAYGTCFETAVLKHLKREIHDFPQFNQFIDKHFNDQTNVLRGTQILLYEKLCGRADFVSDQTIFEVKCYENPSEIEIYKAATQLLLYSVHHRRKNVVLLYPQQDLKIQVIDIDYPLFQEQCQKLCQNLELNQEEHKMSEDFKYNIFVQWHETNKKQKYPTQTEMFQGYSIGRWYQVMLSTQYCQSLKQLLIDNQIVQFADWRELRIQYLFEQFRLWRKNWPNQHHPLQKMMSDFSEDDQDLGTIYANMKINKYDLVLKQMLIDSGDFDFMDPEDILYHEFELWHIACPNEKYPPQKKIRRERYFGTHGEDLANIWVMMTTKGNNPDVLEKLLLNMICIDESGQDFWFNLIMQWREDHPGQDRPKKKDPKYKDKDLYQMFNKIMTEEKYPGLKGRILNSGKFDTLKPKE